MNPLFLLRAGQFVFKLRKLIALAVLLEFAAKRSLSKSNKKSSKKKKDSTDVDMQAMANDLFAKAQTVYADVKKQASKR